jgi:hypothetical protein
MGEKRDTRRAVLTGGAVLLGAAVVGSQGTAEAANGNALLVGRTTNTASAETRLTSSGNAPGLRLVTSNTGGGAIALYAVARGGYGAYLESTSNVGASIWTKHQDKYGVVAVNAATKGSGGAVRADGRQNVGLFATTDNLTTTAITARNNATNDPARESRAIVATAANSAAELSFRLNSRAAIEGAGYHGVIGFTNGSGTGVAGITTHPNTYGVTAYGTGGGKAFLAQGTAEIQGNLAVSGTVSKAGGSFRIDHPLDPADKYLSHSFVESPDMKNIYDGVATADWDGEARVELPEWFEALNKDFRYQLTPIGPAAPELRIGTEIEDNAFRIAGAQPGQRISWQVTGTRKDAWANANRIPVEHDKPANEKGSFLFPEGFGRPQADSLQARYPHPLR